MIIDEIIEIGNKYYDRIKEDGVVPVAHRASEHWFFWFIESRSRVDLFAAYITDNQPQEHGPLMANPEWSWEQWKELWLKK